MHCCILKCTFPPYISIYRARDLVIRFIEPILEEFNYVPPDKEVQDYIVKYFGRIVHLQERSKPLCIYLKIKPLKLHVNVQNGNRLILPKNWTRRKSNIVKEIKAHKN